MHLSSASYSNSSNMVNTSNEELYLLSSPIGFIDGDDHLDFHYRDSLEIDGECMQSSTFFLEDDDTINEENTQQENQRTPNAQTTRTTTSDASSPSSLETPEKLLMNLTMSSKYNSSDSANIWGPWDCPLGRSQLVREAPGNLKYRELVEYYRPAYLSAKRRVEKTNISHQIYKVISQNGGRFLDNKHHDGEWQEITPAKAISKISQALRLGTGRSMTYSRSLSASSCSDGASYSSSAGSASSFSKKAGTHAASSEKVFYRQPSQDRDFEFYNNCSTMGGNDDEEGRMERQHDIHQHHQWTRNSHNKIDFSSSLVIEKRTTSTTSSSSCKHDYMLWDKTRREDDPRQFHQKNTFPNNHLQLGTDTVRSSIETIEHPGGCLHVSSGSNFGKLVALADIEPTPVPLVSSCIEGGGHADRRLPEEDTTKSTKVPSGKISGINSCVVDKEENN